MNLERTEKEHGEKTELAAYLSYKFCHVYLQEAYVKALGRGFSGAPFRDFTIRFENSTDSVVPERPKSEVCYNFLH